MPYANCFPNACIGEGDTARSDLDSWHGGHDNHHFAALDGGRAIKGVHRDYGICLDAPSNEETHDRVRRTGAASYGPRKSTGLDSNIGRPDGTPHRYRVIGYDDRGFGRYGDRNIDGPLNHARCARDSKVYARADRNVGGQAGLQRLIARNQLQASI